MSHPDDRSGDLPSSPSDKPRRKDLDAAWEREGIERNPAFADAPRVYREFARSVFDRGYLQAKADCGCIETYPQLIPGRVSHGPGCTYAASHELQNAEAQVPAKATSGGNAEVDDGNRPVIPERKLSATSDAFQPCVSAPSNEQQKRATHDTVCEKCGARVQSIMGECRRTGCEYFASATITPAGGEDEEVPMIRDDKPRSLVERLRSRAWDDRQHRELRAKAADQIEEMERQLSTISASVSETAPKFTEVPIARCPRCGHCENAPSAIERKPVAWRYRYHYGAAGENKGMWKYADSEDECNRSPYYEREALYVE